jgi:hypothetical protein
MNKTITGNIIEITDGNIVTFDSVLGVSEYGENYIVLKLKSYSVKVSGDDIRVSELEGGFAKIDCTGT